MAEDSRLRDVLERLWEIRQNDEESNVNKLFYAVLDLAEALVLPADANAHEEFVKWREEWREKRY